MRRLLAALLLPLAFSPASAADNFSPAQKAEIERVVRGYLLEHPEILQEMIEALKNGQALDAIRENQTALYEDKISPVLGNAAGDVTIVEFFTYRCSVCRAVYPKLKNLIAADGRVKVIQKQLPIFDVPDGRDPTASKAAYAAWRLDPRKFAAFHDALLSTKEQPNDDVVMAAAKKAGYDTTALRRQMGDKLYDKLITNDFKLADQLGVTGTPAYVIGDRMIVGWDEEALKKAIARARAAKAQKRPGA